MRWRGVPNRETTFEQPSSKTLNVGAPTFSYSGSRRGGFMPPSSFFVLADLQVGASTVCRHATLAGLKTGHYTNRISSVVSR